MQKETIQFKGKQKKKKVVNSHMRKHFPEPDEFKMQSKESDNTQIFKSCSVRIPLIINIPEGMLCYSIFKEF